MHFVTGTLCNTCAVYVVGEVAIFTPVDRFIKPSSLILQILVIIFAPVSY